jgi:nucleoside-diphosphate-sugar epimerase
MRTSLVRRLLDSRDDTFHLDTPDARRDWTYVEDLPLALDALLQQHDGDLLAHLGSGAILTDRQLADRIVRQLDAPIKISEAEAPCAATKAPMISDLATDFQWTPFDVGLARTSATEARL